MFASFHKNTSLFLFFFFHIHLQIYGVYFSMVADDRLALMAIKSEIKHDPQGVMISWNESFHFCQWPGVICDRRHRRVTALDLTSKGLVGSLSPYIGNMSFLIAIVLQNNTFEGRIPPELGRLRRLEVLGLLDNSFDGEIPSNLSRCSHLLYLRLDNNKLFGRIPREFSSLIMLRKLGLSKNALTGTIPSFIGNLTSLQVLSFGINQLGGIVPDAFHQLKNLYHLSFSDNDLVGTIPPSIYHLPLLEELSISFNRLQGSLPKNIGSMLPLLRVFYVNDNRLTGPLPPSISNLTHAEAIEVGGNNFTGKIAINFGGLQDLRILDISKTSLGSGEADEMKFIDSLSNCSSLGWLAVGGNKLIKGVLPASIGNLSEKLQWLYLGSNSLYGSFPSSIGNLIGLNELDLNGNQLTGITPTSIGKLQNLNLLYVDGNDFSGEIPGSIGNLSALLKLDMSYNRIEGNIPTSLGRCRNLLDLSLYQNKLSGSIPREIFSHMPLSIRLDLGQNNLSGPLPPEVGNLKGTSLIDLSENYLSGELPRSLASCTSLEFLYLYVNCFQGSIPTSFASLRALQLFDLSSNNFSGHIPSFLEGIPLRYLDLSFNNFEGEIPMRGVFSNSSALSIIGNDNLCGGMPQLGQPKCRSKKDQKEMRHKSSLAIILSTTIFATLAGAMIASFFLFKWCTKKRKHQPSPSSLKGSLEKVSFEQLLKATQGFSTTNLIGTGGFASVYRGILGENGVNVAVKVVNLGRHGGPKSFDTECEALRKIRHRNLVKVITCCSSVDFQGNDFKAIIYEYMENGSLEMWLRSSIDPVHGLHYLSLRHRISVANDVACALDYLHHQCGETFVHCDLKPSNILFDGDMVVHVGDFGLAKFLLPGVSNRIHSSSVGIRGSIGYAAKEYGLGSEVSTKGDVYSFGILLLEMVTGKKPTDPMFQESLNLHGYANTALAHHRVLDIVDPTILQDDGVVDAATIIVRNNESIKEATDYNGKEECCTLLVRIGVACSVERPENRMDITNVIHELKSLCKYQF